MFGHAKAADVVTEIMQVLENLSLPFKLMLSLGIDGPNVNKSILDEFLTKFQKEEPMIHLLYPNCEKLLKLIIGRLMRNSVYKDKHGKDLKQVDVEKVEKQLKKG